MKKIFVALLLSTMLLGGCGQKQVDPIDNVVETYLSSYSDDELPGAYRRLVAGVVSDGIESLNGLVPVDKDVSVDVEYVKMPYPSFYISVTKGDLTMNYIVVRHLGD